MMQILSLNQQGRTNYNHVHRVSWTQTVPLGSTASFFGLVYQLIVAFVGQARAG
jgi:hypothetical protein